MPTHIGREDVQRLVTEGVQLVEVIVGVVETPAT
jgi:hypothetical protein